MPNRHIACAPPAVEACGPPQCGQKTSPVPAGDVCAPCPDSNIPAEDLSLLAEQAARLGISRTEYLRRHRHRGARRTAGSVTAGDLRAVAELWPDFGDDTVISGTCF